MPRYLFVRRDGWTRYVDVPSNERVWALAEQIGPQPTFDAPPCRMHKDCIQNEEMAYECSRSRMVSPGSAMARRRLFERYEFATVPWREDRYGRPTVVFLEEGLRPEDFVQRWREYST
jgi:hypothetical protein